MQWCSIISSVVRHLKGQGGVASGDVGDDAGVVGVVVVDDSAVGGRRGRAIRHTVF
jgi:hypothetical protein